MRIKKVDLFLIFLILIAGFILFTTSRAINIELELRKTDYNCKLRDPTYSEMREFLACDKTDLNKFRDRGLIAFFFRYDCSNFAKDVKRNAIEEGIRCAVVILEYKNQEKGHAIIAFNTTDRGVIFIEPQSDMEAMVSIGVEYWGNIVSKYQIFWPNLTR